MGSSRAPIALSRTAASPASAAAASLIRPSASATNCSLLRRQSVGRERAERLGQLGVPAGQQLLPAGGRLALGAQRGGRRCRVGLGAAQLRARLVVRGGEVVQALHQAGALGPGGGGVGPERDRGVGRGLRGFRGGGPGPHGRERPCRPGTEREADEQHGERGDDVHGAERAAGHRQNRAAAPSMSPSSGQRSTSERRAVEHLCDRGAGESRRLTLAATGLAEGHPAATGLAEGHPATGRPRRGPPPRGPAATA